MVSTSRGVLVVMEGSDRSGKTTQCKILQQHIAKVTGKPCEYLNFPNRTTPLGQIINAYLQGDVQLNKHSIHLLFSANRWELADRIQELLQSGTNVILDRYAYSGTAYSVAKGLDREWCWNPDRGLPAPDFIFYLDLPLEVTMQRAGFGEERYERGDMQKRVREAFKTIIDSKWNVVDANCEMDTLTAKLTQRFDELLSSQDPRSQPIGKLI